MRVAYQGEPGAFSEAAVLRLLADAEPRPYPTFDEVFDAVTNGSVNLGVKGTALSVVGRNPGAGDVELLDVLLRIGQVLDEQNIPEEGRWVVMPAWAGRMIKQSELRQAYLSGDSVSMLRNGRLGMVDRFTVYISNLLPNNSTNSADTVTGVAGNSTVIDCQPAPNNGGCTAQLPPGTDVALFANGNCGDWGPNSFWTGVDSQQGNAASVTMNENRNVTANYVPDFNIC